MALSVDGQRVVSGSRDRTLRVWDLETGNCLAISTSNAEVSFCDWAGALIVTGDRGGPIRLRSSQVHLFAWEE